MLYGALCLIWGSTWLAIKIGLDGVPPFLGAGLRFLIATIIVAVVVAARGMPRRLTHADRICILSTGLLVFWIDYAAVYWAEGYISSGLTAVLFSTMPLMTALMSAYWTKTERLHPRKLIGIVIGVAGTVLLFWPAERVGVMQVLGMLSALLGSLCAAINLVTVKRHGGNTDSWVLNLFGMALGTACLLATSAATESWRTAIWTPANVGALAYLAVFGSVVAFSIYYFLLKKMDATVLSLTTLVIPVVALALGRVVLHEAVTGTAIVGILTILAGVGFAIVPARRARVTPPLPAPRDDARAPW